MSSAGGVEPDNQVERLLGRIRASNAFTSNLGAGECIEECGNVKEEKEEKEQAEEKDLANEVIDKNPRTKEDRKLDKLLMPRGDRFVLSCALKGHENLESFLPDMLRLCYLLRHGELGADHDILPKPHHARDKVKSDIKKWQNRAMHEMSLMDAADKVPNHRVSRESAWIKACEAHREKHAPTLPPSLRTDRGQTVAYMSKCGWQLGFILSVWRHYSGKSGGAQLVAGEISRGSVHSVRVVCFLDILASNVQGLVYNFF